MKYVNIEFFDEEAIENVITCLNYKMDKVIFFGYKEIMTAERTNIIENYLKDRCNVKEAEFKEVNKENLEEITARIEEALDKERKDGNRCYFDLTGGEDLVLVAIGMLAEKYDIPLHKYDVPSNKLICFHKDKERRINKSAGKQENPQINLDDIIGMRGGCINYRKHKDYKENLEQPEVKKDILNMWEIARKDPKRWNAFSMILKGCNKYVTKDTIVTLPLQEWRTVVSKEKKRIDRNRVNDYMNALQKTGALIWNGGIGKNVKIIYKDMMVKECILDAGCLLELITYYNRKDSGKYSDVRVGVHLDWDGKIIGNDVENEIDVMVLEGNVPTFISCKNGEVTTPAALYELDSVAKEMGGKYAKKELALGAGISPVQRRRAESMDINIYEINQGIG